MSVRLRRARRADAPAIIALERHFPADRFAPRAIRYLLRSRSATLWVAVAGGGIIGALVMLGRRRTRVARIYSVVVSPAVRGRGLGAAMIREAEREARRRRRTVMSLEVRERNRAARALYAGLGYEVFQRLPKYYGDGAAGLRLRKNLS